MGPHGQEHRLTITSDTATRAVHAAEGGAQPPAPLAPARLRVRAFIRLARPIQWAKGAFVVLGPLYWLADGHLGEATGRTVLSVIGAVLVFGFASSACYVVNDIRDREADALHPRKSRRPIAAGVISPAAARWFAALLLVLAGASLLLVPARPALFLAGAAGLYVANTMVYSVAMKHVIILDVISLAAGFVLRVLGGCAAIAIVPSTWLLNSTFFLAMFLAFGKRLGERRTMGPEAASIRAVQSGYTDELLRMAVVVTAVATLLTYAGYVQSREDRFELGFNLLWLTVLPATFGLLRAIVLLERGAYDDPTELASRDRPFQASVLLFGLSTAAAIAATWEGGAGPAGLGGS